MNTEANICAMERSGSTQRVEGFAEHWLDPGLAEEGVGTSRPKCRGTLTRVERI